MADMISDTCSIRWGPKLIETNEIFGHDLNNCCYCWCHLVPWTARRSNQSILKEISPEYSLVEMMLKLKLQYFGHLMWRTDSLKKTLTLGKIEGRRRRGTTEDEMVGWNHDSVDMSLSKLQELVMDGESWHATVHWVTKSWTRLSDWTVLNCLVPKSFLTLISCGLPGFSVHGISQQEYWNELAFSSPGNLPDSGIELASPMSLLDSLPLSYLRSHAIVKYR